MRSVEANSSCKSASLWLSMKQLCFRLIFHSFYLLSSMKINDCASLLNLNSAGSIKSHIPSLQYAPPYQGDSRKERNVQSNLFLRMYDLLLNRIFSRRRVLVY